jgi:hypothetical protein
MSQLAANGGQPQKAPKYAPIYQGRFFNGINTNRSPLRAASASHIAEKFYSDNSGDAMIAGSNIEVTNRLTLGRRPGNPIFDLAHQYNDPDAFDEFRVNKAQSDVFGTTIEQIFTMIDETGSGNFLYSFDASSGKRGGDSAYKYGLKFQKASGAGQTFMQEVGNSLYLANGVQNKKWLTSLFVRNSAGNNQFLQGSDGLAGTYPFGTYLIDPATGNIQQFIGISIGNVTNVNVSNNILTLTITVTDDTRDYPIGTSFQLWGMTSNPWLNGATITLTSEYDHTLFGRTFVGTTTHANTNTPESGQAFVIQTGTQGGGSTIYVAETGNSVPTWGTTLPAISNDFQGSLTEDGNTIWLNRGVNYPNESPVQQPSVMNWGIKAPKTAPAFTSSGAAVSWQTNTYYSPVSVFIDPTFGNLWQITTPGTTGSAQPTWPASPVHQQKVIITGLYADGTNIFVKTDTQSPALVAGDTVVFQNMCTFANGQGSFPDLEGVSVTVSATGLTTTAFQAPYTANVIGSGSPIAEYGQAIKTAGTNPPTTVSESGHGGTAVWTSIQLAASLTWQAHTHYNVGDFIVSPTKFLFQLGRKTQPFINTALGLHINMNSLNEPQSLQNSAYQGAFPYFNSGDPAISGLPNWQAESGFYTNQNLSSVWLQRTQPPGSGSSSTPYGENAVNGAGEVGANSSLAAVSSSWVGVIKCYVFIPRPGTYTFTCQHNDGAIFCFDSQGIDTGTVAPGAFKASGGTDNVSQTISPGFGFGRPGGVDLCGTNTSDRTGPGPFAQSATKPADSATWNFPQAGNYALEIDYAKWYHSGGYMVFMCPGSGGAPAQTLAVGRDESGTSAPSWPAFTKTGAGFDTTNEVIIWGGNVVEVSTAGQQYLWNNVGPKSDFVWVAGKNYTLPGTVIIDTNSNQQGAYETGITGTVQPTWSNTTVGSILADPNPPLQWINEGSVPNSSTQGNTITALSQQGWLYWIALVNTLDQTVSNVSPVSLPTGPISKGQITFPAGSGLDVTQIDPQADYVAIFRSADGFSTPLLIPGFVNSPYTVPLAQYLAYGYVDTVPDAELNNLEQGAQAGENTPPATGAKNLSYHLSQIWYSIGNTVYYTTGPLAPIGNGTDGTAPGNFAECSSQVRRLVPTAIGMLVFTVSDVYIIAGNGTSTSPILPAIPYLTGIGLANYNALDINGGLIGFFTTDKQFVIFDPSAGLSYVGFNIGDQFRLNNGQPGQSWNTSTVYVTWYVNGEDAAWYVADGVNGWFKCIATPAPEQGSVAWSPFATIVGGAGAIRSVETTPGVHTLLVGQTTSTSNLLYRNLSATTDNGTGNSNGSTYSAYGVIGSIVLAQPGQIAKLAFITTDSVNVGSPLILGVILDEALPYYTGSFDILKDWKTDPTNMPQSTSILSQRFYLAENTEDSAYCKHLQIMCQWPPEAAMNELQTLTVFGAYEIEQ